MFKKRHPNPGARPGTLHVSETAPPPKIRLVHYSEETVHTEEIDDPHRLGQWVAADGVTWVDVQGLGDEETLQTIATLFGLHPLAMEDVVNVPQRPKAEVYGNQQLVICRVIHPRGVLQWDIEQIGMVIGPNYVITFQHRYGDILEPVRRRIDQRTSRLRAGGADYLAYAVIDTIIDGYYPVLETVGDQLERLEELVLEAPGPALLRDLNRVKNRIVNLRRSIWPQREAIYALMHEGNDLVSQPVQLFLRDTHDHCVQTTEVIEMYREMVTGLVNLYLSAMGQRTNEVMKVLTIMASIFIPLTFVAGVYGMNFENMPELQYRWSYPAVWGVMAATVAGMLWFFHRKGWIGKRAATGLDQLLAAEEPDTEPHGRSVTTPALRMAFPDDAHANAPSQTPTAMSKAG
jgi:magnesium transporter